VTLNGNIVYGSCIGLSHQKSKRRDMCYKPSESSVYVVVVEE
jgi:hypothetical protein